MTNNRANTKKNFEKFVQKNSGGDSKSKQTANQHRPLEDTVRDPKDNRIKELEQKVRALDAENQRKDSQQERRNQSIRNQQDDKAIKDMEHGSDSHPQKGNVFDKTYHLSYINPSTGKKQSYSLHFEVRPASFADQTRISAEVTNLTNRLGKYFEVNNYSLVEAFASFRVLGIKVPQAFKDPAKMYRPDLLEMVYIDFLEWERNFRQYHMD